MYELPDVRVAMPRVRMDRRCQRTALQAATFRRVHQDRHRLEALPVDTECQNRGVR